MIEHDIRRELLERAIKRAQPGKGAVVLDVSSVTGISVDAAFLIVRAIEKLRDREGRRGGALLRRLVRQAAVESGLPPDRRYAYEVIAMNYYGIIKQFIQA